MRKRTLFTCLCPGCCAGCSALKLGLNGYFHYQWAFPHTGFLYTRHSLPLEEGRRIRCQVRTRRHPARRPFCHLHVLTSRTPTLPWGVITVGLHGGESSVLWALALWLPVCQGPRVVMRRADISTLLILLWSQDFPGHQTHLASQAHI